MAIREIVRDRVDSASWFEPADSDVSASKIEELIKSQYSKLYEDLIQKIMKRDEKCERPGSLAGFIKTFLVPQDIIHSPEILVKYPDNRQLGVYVEAFLSFLNENKIKE